MGGKLVHNRGRAIAVLVLVRYGILGFRESGVGSRESGEEN
jgi:hypothetical protein